LGYSVLTVKERTTIERDLKQIMKEIKESSADASDPEDQIDFSQGSSLASAETDGMNKPRRSSMFVSFINSVSTGKTSSRTSSTTKNASSFADELNLYKSLAIKETQRVIESGSNPDVIKFW
jgi:hypothetical protein